MTITGYTFGRMAYWDDALQGERWMDTHEAVDENPRPCPKCGKMPAEDGSDPCIGHVPGATSICCGHGVHEPYGRIDDELLVGDELLAKIARKQRVSNDSNGG